MLFCNEFSLLFDWDCLVFAWFLAYFGAFCVFFFVSDGLSQRRSFLGQPCCFFDRLFFFPVRATAAVTKKTSFNLDRVALCSSGVEIALGKNVGVQKFARKYRSENADICTPPPRAIIALLGVLGVPRSLLGVGGGLCHVRVQTLAQ